MPETDMEKIMRARESRSVDHLARIIRARESCSVDCLAEALAALVNKAELQHKTFKDSIQTSQKALSLTVTRTMISIAVGVGLLVGIASGIGSWILLKDHYIKTELAMANESIFRPGPLLVKPAAAKYIPLPQKLIPKGKILE